MRAIIKKTVLVVLMFATLFVSANENEKPSKAKKTVKVEFKNVKVGHTLKIKDKQGIVVYKDKIKTEGNFTKNFDFTALENGVFSMELEKDFEIVIKEFSIKDGFVTFLETDNTSIFKPVIRTKNDLLLITKLCFNNEPLNITIYYDNEVILEDNAAGAQILNKAYKLSLNKTGNYKVVIYSDDRKYSKDFTI
ncbi:hypothetical protein [uncultured Polaribacter sp.]|uniref:hypothetical protein n=1 Tax=uncultured Polaribacter sp. TaxID=174711 RepID=UPI002603F3EF|nr:hypothetical protein [uncultured Polaribacter sp.]